MHLLNGVLMLIQFGVRKLILGPKHIPDKGALAALSNAHQVKAGPKLHSFQDGVGQKPFSCVCHVLQYCIHTAILKYTKLTLDFGFALRAPEALKLEYQRVKISAPSIICGDASLVSPRQTKFTSILKKNCRMVIVGIILYRILYFNF